MRPSMNSARELRHKVCVRADTSMIKGNRGHTSRGPAQTPHTCAKATINEKKVVVVVVRGGGGTCCSLSCQPRAEAEFANSRKKGSRMPVCHRVVGGWSKGGGCNQHIWMKRRNGMGNEEL